MISSSFKGRPKHADPVAIVEALQHILLPGQVTELRALDAVTATDRRPHVESGYFDDLQKMAGSAATIQSAKGIYFLPNPVNPALLARANNRLRPAFKEPLTADHDIERRRFLLVDLDPVRPAGISSSEAEHKAAHKLAAQMIDELAADGWPEPIYADSGNGAHLLYFVDLPADDGGSVKESLEALDARFSTSEVQVDTTTANPARIWKLPGTLSAKGDSTPERPHRLSRIISIPQLKTPVPGDLLQALAEMYQTNNAQPNHANRYVNNVTFDLDKWIAEHNVPVRGPEPWKNGRRWVFDICPWNPDHTDHSAFILEFANGAWTARCHHNGCKAAGHNHESLRDIYEPGWRDRKASHYLGIVPDAAKSSGASVYNGSCPASNSAVTDALERLATALQGGPAAVYQDADLLEGLAGLKLSEPVTWALARDRLREAKVKLREFDAVLKPILDRKRTSFEKSPLYITSAAGSICRVQQTYDGPIEIPLCNFDARVVEQVTADDGAEQSTRLAIEGQLAGGRKFPRVEVSVEDFARMNWATVAWGAQAVVYAGPSIRDHLRAAIQLLSGDVPRRDVFGHPGWRKIGDSWAFLHAGGAIGPTGPMATVSVTLPEVLSGFRLPVPPIGNELLSAVRASLRLVELAPPRISFPLIAAAYRAPLGPCDFSMHLCGGSGVFKTAIAALAQQHFGAELDAGHLPANWTSTANAIEELAFAAKDSLLIADDFKPNGSSADVQRAHREADRVFRAQGNRAGRQRMRSDGTLRAARPPRGLIVGTGEDVPRGESLRARMLILEVSPGDIQKATLTICQRDAGAGFYAASMAGYLRWLAPQYADTLATLRQETAALRDAAAAEGQHARTPALVGELGFGLFQFLKFAVAIGAITTRERTDLWGRGWAALLEAAGLQHAQQAAGEPAQHFLRLLSAALASGRAHVADKSGSWPRISPQVFGWREDRHGNVVAWVPQGKRIGWCNEHDIFLEPEASYAEAQKLATEQGDSLGVTAQVLRKRLADRGLLVTTDLSRNTLTVRRTL